MTYFFLAASGGAIGAGLRYLVNVATHRWLGPAFPWGTVCVNVVGCLLMGLLAGLLVGREQETAALRIFLATGILGGFTTFSAFSLDFAHLFDRGATLAAFGYVLGSVVVSILSLYAGIALAKALHP